MTHNKSWFINYKSFHKDVWVRIGDGSLLKASGSGDINIFSFNGENWIPNHLSNVIYVPELKYNLFSSNVVLDKGLQLSSDHQVCKFTKGDKTIIIGERSGNLFVMKIRIEKPSHENRAMVAQTDSLSTWHEKFAHQNYKTVKEVLHQQNITVKDTAEPFCDACAIGKTHRLPFPASVSKSTFIGEIVHPDLGPMQEKSIKGSKYFLLLKDDFSHYRTLYFIAAKSDVHSCLEDYVKKTEKHCPKGIKIL